MQKLTVSSVTKFLRCSILLGSMAASAAIAQEAPMPRARIHSREHIEVDTIGLDRPVHECAHDLVLAAG